MGSKTQDRSYHLLIVIMALFLILILRLFALTIIQGEEWKNASDSIRVKEIYTIAPRGEILDRYGRVLAGNKPSFVVQIVRNEVTDENINEMAITLLSILEANGDSHTKNFPIEIKDGKYYFSYDKRIEQWLENQEFPVTYTAEETFEAIRERYKISEALDKYDAQIELQKRHQVYPIISVKNMEYLPNLDKKTFLGSYNIDDTLSVNEVFEEFRKEFKIDNSYSDDQALKIMIIRNELVSQGYSKYKPVKIAYGVSDQTIITIEEKSDDLHGIEVVVEPLRDYKQDNLVSHIIGYLGRISESEKATYSDDKRYLSSDLIGKEGIEKTYENILKGKTGIKNVEVDSMGRLIKEIEEVTPEKGKNVYLTIDAKLQSKARESLAYALEQIQIGGTYDSVWGSYNYKQYENAKTGAVVVLDVKTGEVLSMVSLPDYNPNLFTEGISEEDWNALQNTNVRDSLSPTPLYNIAARTAVQPGSTFKMITGLAALEKGLSPTTLLVDGGVVELGSRTFACHIWNSSRGNHGAINLMTALEVSCNYFFFDLINDYDFYKDQSLGLGIEAKDVMDIATKFGLNDKTGIEIPETAVGVPDEEKKLNQTKNLLKRMIINNAGIYFEDEVVSNPDMLNVKIDNILSWVEENPSRNEVARRLKSLEVKEDKLYEFTDIIKYSYYNLAMWGTGDKMNLSIGQGDNAYTVLQMTNYIAAIANGGYLNELTLIKEIEGEELPEKKSTKIDLNDDGNLEYLKEGMLKVTAGSRGITRSLFWNFPIEIAGKSGTAEKHGKIQPKDEVEYIKENLKKINSRLGFEDVEEEMLRLMASNPQKYDSRSFAVREAVINLSDGRVTTETIDYYKDDYADFSWFAGYGPYNDPEIAVVVLITQGGSGNYAAPVAREIFAEYLGLNEDYDRISIDNTITE